MKLPKIIFSAWTRWADRASVDGIDMPGLYLLAQFKKPPIGDTNLQAQEIIYIGETCKRTLKKRWDNFHRAAFKGKKKIHSGGETYRQEFGDKGSNLFVAAFPVSELDNQLRPLFIRYVERKLILDYALMRGAAPKCNKE